MNEQLKASLERYTKAHGPEPDIDYRKPDLLEQHKRWSEWWLNWYKLPLNE